MPFSDYTGIESIKIPLDRMAHTNVILYSVEQLSDTPLPFKDLWFKETKVSASNNVFGIF